MKSEDMGIDPGSGIHDKNLTHAESAFVQILWQDHVGRDFAVSADAFAARLSYELVGIPVASEAEAELVRLRKQTDAKGLELGKRCVRILHNHLLFDHDDIPVLSKAGAGGGYWIAGSREEMEEFFDAFRARGITGIKKAARGRKVGVIDAFKQLTFEFEDTEKNESYTRRIKRRVALPGALDVVDAYLERMMADPEKFADGLRKIGQKYGSVLLPKGQVEALAAKAAELQELVASIGGGQ